MLNKYLLIFFSLVIINGNAQNASFSLTDLESRNINQSLRPQTPESPIPYKEENLSYFNKDKSIQFGATLTLPSSKKQLPVVILISGSGQQNRDEELFGHKPFWVIADYLSRNGIAVLRVDDRGVGETTGSSRDATSEDYAKDVLAGIEYLKTRKEINIKQIGLIGHSEGGIIAPLVANMSQDVAFIVSLAGVGVKGGELYKKQRVDLYSSAGFDSKSIIRLNTLDEMLFKLSEDYSKLTDLKKAFQVNFRQWLYEQPEDFLLKVGFMGENADKNISRMAATYFTPWTNYIINYDPATTIGKLNIPVLAMNGEKDVQVSAKENLAGFEKNLTQANNKNYKIVSLPNLNHMFQTSNTGFIDEYAKIEETFSPVALKIMTDWIKAQVKK